VQLNQIWPLRALFCRPTHSSASPISPFFCRKRSSAEVAPARRNALCLAGALRTAHANCCSARKPHCDSNPNVPEWTQEASEAPASPTPQGGARCGRNPAPGSPSALSELDAPSYGRETRLSDRGQPSLARNVRSCYLWERWAPRGKGRPVQAPAQLAPSSWVGAASFLRLSCGLPRVRPCQRASRC
jgi:hypothetical protein